MDLIRVLTNMSWKIIVKGKNKPAEKWSIVDMLLDLEKNNLPALLNYQQDINKWKCDEITDHCTEIGMMNWIVDKFYPILAVE